MFILQIRPIGERSGVSGLMALPFTAAYVPKSNVYLSGRTQRTEQGLPSADDAKQFHRSPSVTATVA